VPYPKRLLSPGEEIVREFRPHWTSILPSLVVTLTALLAVGALALFVDGPAGQFGPAAVAVVWLAVIARPVIRWLTTQHVITNERVIHRTGWVSKRGMEIPLEMINTVAFSQTVFERLVGSGDLVIESAATRGQTRYTDIPDPEGLQTLIYKVREGRMFTLEGGGSLSPAEQLAILARLHDEGKISAEEFSTQKQRLLGVSEE
jgi:membrane protein YdbS with pleckstrin-like domain